ncbi:hypothetical protein AAE021_06985 [Arthrobacter citreus]|uniref:Uncharacterized protein n=1 Tax=Arthrobacter citreus TaxID=1670 RepID=A0ABZ2ZZ10_9MICC
MEALTRLHDAGEFGFGEGVRLWEGLLAVVGVRHALDRDGAGGLHLAAAVDVLVCDAPGVHQLGDDPAAGFVHGVGDSRRRVPR